MNKVSSESEPRGLVTGERATCTSGNPDFWFIGAQRTRRFRTDGRATQSDFSYWESAEQAIRFREALSPIVIRMEFRLAELENPARQHGVRLGQVATRQNAINELKRASIVMRAESYRRRLFSEFDRAKEMFLP